MNMIHIGISVLTMFLIGIGIQLLEVKRGLKIIFIGVWGTTTLWLLFPFSNPTNFAIWRFIEVEKMNMVNMNISAVGMILMGISIRFLAMNRLPKTTLVIIWGLVTIRLLVPFSISTRFSVWNLFYRPSGMEEGLSIASYSSISQLEQASTQLSLGADNELARIIINIWVIGMIISASYFIFTHYRFRKEISDSLPVTNEFVSEWISERKMIRSIQIRQTHKISSPLTYGIFRPIILMPKTTDWQDETQLRYIFAHEYIHIQRFDYATKILFAIALCIHWFNPLIWIMYALANRDIELSCDEKVLKIFGQKSKSSYALTLIKMAENQNKFTALCNNFSRNATEERIKVMINMKKTSIFGTAIALTLVGGTMTALAASNEGQSISIFPTTPIVEESTEHMETPSQEVVLSEQELEEMMSGGEISTEEIVKIEIVEEGTGNMETLPQEVVLSEQELEEMVSSGEISAEEIIKIEVIEDSVIIDK